MIAEIEADAATERHLQGITLLGVKAIRRQNPRRQPKAMKRSPAPAFHAASQRARRELQEAYRWFVSAYREAAERLRAKKPSVSFPRGCFPPPLPFARLETGQMA